MVACTQFSLELGLQLGLSLQKVYNLASNQEYKASNDL